MSNEPKPKIIPWKQYDKKPLVFNNLKEGQIITFNYKSHLVNDRTPLIYVLEVRGNRVYGLNLRYKPELFYSIMNHKDKQIKQIIDNKVKEMSHKKEFLGLENTDLYSSETKDLIYKQIPEIYKNYFDYPGIKKNYSEILRNYLKSYIINIFQIFYTKR